MILKQNFPVERLTSFHQTGTLKTLYVPETVADITSFLKEHPLHLIIGKGSNSILHPSCFSLPILQLPPHLTTATYSEGTLRVPAGMHVSKLMQFQTQHHISCLEFSAGVPATVGGMVAMNFGCWGTCVADVFMRARVIDANGQETWVSKDDMEFGYRSSMLQHSDYVLIEAEFKASPIADSDLKQTLHDMLNKRMSHQPLRAHTFGSIFKNPTGHFSGQLLEESGLKGFVLGPVKLSDRHANFMENLGGATYEDIEKLLVHAMKIVEKKTGILLELEVKIHKAGHEKLNIPTRL